MVVPETAVTFTLYGNSLYVVVEQDQPSPPNPCTSALGGLLCSLGLAKAPPATDQPPPSLVVERRFVSTGERRDGQVVILKGLQAGERVVTVGQLKLDNGARVILSDEQAIPHTPTRQPDAN